MIQLIVEQLLPSVVWWIAEGLEHLFYFIVVKYFLGSIQRLQIRSWSTILLLFTWLTFGDLVFDQVFFCWLALNLLVEAN